MSSRGQLRCLVKLVLYRGLTIDDWVRFSREWCWFVKDTGPQSGEVRDSRTAMKLLRTARGDQPRTVRP